MYKDALEAGERICFVFPSRRAAVFFRQYLSEMIGKPLFSPDLVTINELFARISDLKAADRITLLMRLYSCYSELVPEPESLDEFVFWGDTLIADFNDVDKYMADARHLFMNVSDLDALKDDFSYLTDTQKEAIRRFWGHYFKTAQGNVSHVKKVFHGNWSLMYPLYEEFNRRLLKEGISYDGMLYRKTAEKILACADDPLPGYSKAVFVGLNALNECEKVLLRRLRKDGKADFHWDFFGGMLKDESNAASLFMRANIKEFPPSCPLEDDDEAYPEVVAVSVASAVAGAKCAGKILDSLGGKIGRETAVMLPDSSLLEPLLDSVPLNAGTINVTMGCPMSGSALASFMSSLKDLQFGCRKTSSGTKFYHRPVLDLLGHRYLSGQDNVQDVTVRMFRQNIVYVEPSFLAVTPLLALVFRPVIDDADSQDSTRALEAYCKDVLWELGKLGDGKEREFVKRYYSSVVRLADMRLPVKPATWFRLLEAIVSGISVPFKGEPLAGLQIMGPLETRALDFRNVIITSMNEGIFPSRSADNSFIPYILRKGFGLPVYEYEDAMWAYYFYRLVSRADKVWLITDSRVGGIKAGGESRYVKQLEYLYSGKVRFSRAEVPLRSGQMPSVEPPVIEKSPGTMRVLEERFLKERKIFSPSLLNDYISCPLKFYFKYVLEEPVDGEIVDDLDPGKFGSWYHGVMCSLYRPFEGREVTASDLAAISRDDIRKTADAVFEKETSSREIRGLNLVNREVIMRLVKRTLEIDRDFAPFKIASLESCFHADLDLDDGRLVRVGGYIDRLDVVDGGLRIIDYKTGSVSLDYKGDVAKVFDTMNNSRPYILLQMFVYQYALDHFPGPLKPLPKMNYVYSLKQMLKSVPEKLEFERECGYPAFETHLKDMIREILDPAVPFRAGLEKNCGNCDFFSICKKTEIKC